jgi:hypothetical protein
MHQSIASAYQKKVKIMLILGSFLKKIVGSVAGWKNEPMSWDDSSKNIKFFQKKLSLVNEKLTFL